MGLWHILQVWIRKIWDLYGLPPLNFFKLGLKWPEQKTPENVGSRFCDFWLFGGLFDFFPTNWPIRRKKSKNPWKSQKSKNLLPKFSGVFCSGHFKPSLKEISQKMAKFYIFEKKILEKKFFRGRGDSPEPKNGGQILKNDF